MGNLEGLYTRLENFHLPALDGMRFIAVTLVIISHMGIKSIPAGHGVMLFFVISGFLITWLLLIEKEKTNTVSLRGFYRRRFFRIFPAFYCFAIITIVLMLAVGKELPVSHIISSLLYVSNYHAALVPNLDTPFSHTWSLAVEEQFYLFFPLIFLFFSSNLKRLKVVICVLIVSAWVWRFVLVYQFGAEYRYIYNAFDTRLDHLMIGCLLAIVLRTRSYQALWRVMLAGSYMPILTVSALLASIYLGEIDRHYASTIGFAVDPILMAILIGQLILFSAKGFWTWLEWRFIKYLGTISYSLYLYQPLTTGSIPGKLAGLPILVQILVTVGATIIVASMSYYLIEKPFLLLKTKSVREVFQHYKLQLRAAIL